MYFLFKKLIKILFFSFLLLNPLEVFSLTNNSLFNSEKIFPELSNILNNANLFSPKSIIYKLDIKESKGEQLNKYSYIYPKISSNYNIGYSSKFYKNKDSKSNIYNEFSIKIEQPIFYWGQLYNERKISNIFRTVNKEKYNQSNINLNKEIRNSYLDILLKKSNLYIHWILKCKIKKIYISYKINFIKGYISSKEFKKIFLEYKKSLLDYENIEQEFYYSINQFRVLTNYNKILLSKDINLIKGIYLLKMYVNKNNNFYFKKTYDKKFIANELEIEKLNYNKLKNLQLPVFNFISEISLNKYNTIISSYWDIFSGFSNESKKIISKVKQKKYLEFIKLENKYDKLELKYSTIKLFKQLKNINIIYKNYIFLLKKHIVYINNVKNKQILFDKFEKHIIDLQNKENELLESLIIWFDIYNQGNNLLINKY